MKHLLKNNSPVILCLALGAVTAVLRFGLYATALDEKNLLAASHPLSVLTWVITAAALALLVLLCLTLAGSNAPGDNFRPNALSALGCLVLALGIGYSVASHWDPHSSPGLVTLAAGSLSVPAMVWAGWCRLKGKTPFFGCHAVTCVYFCVFLVGQYPRWSSNPQLQDYAFFLLACVCLCLFAYQQAAFDLSKGDRRKLLLTGLLAGYFSLASAYGAKDLPLCAAGAFWALTNLCRIQPPSRFLQHEER